MPALDRDGVRIHYEVHGDGPTILLSHGYGSSGRMWQGQLEPLSQGYQLVTWDMRGHGDSDYPEDQSRYSEEHTVADMAAILDAVGADTAIVGGLSLGGYMSLAFRLAYPQRVRALLLFDTGPGFRKDEARERWNATAHRIADRYDQRGLDGLGDGHEVSASMHRDASGLSRAARGMLAQRDARIIDSLPGIDIPTLVLVGADDTDYLAAASYLATKIPGAQKVEIPKAGHAANVDNPQAFNTAVLEFLTSLQP